MFSLASARWFWVPMGDKQRGELVILDRLFTNEPAALALARGDEDFRLLVDRSLSQFYASSAVRRAVQALVSVAFNESTRTYFDMEHARRMTVRARSAEELPRCREQDQPDQLARACRGRRAR